MKDLARASNSSGAATTCVVTEYCYKRDGEFRIEADYFSREEKMEQLSELLGAYRSFHSSSNSSEEEAASLVPEEMADLALNTFKSMFRGELVSEEDYEFILRDDEGSVLDRFEEWIGDRDQLQGTVTERFSGMEECSRRLQTLTSESGSGGASREPAYWPWIQKIRWDPGNLTPRKCSSF